MDIAITDSGGGALTVTTDVHDVAFDVTACSPHADGFTVLNAIIGDRIPRNQLERACQQCNERGEVCILPQIASTRTRVLIVPNSGALDPAGRQKGSMLMMDLFRATQTREVSAKSLLISQFGYVWRYPHAHVFGICDAINELKRQSFLGLRVLGFEVAPSISLQFERDVRQALSVES
jgi:hypothetical protein